MKVLITGTDGFLGKKLVNILKKKYEVFGISRRNARENIFFVDITKRDGIERIVENINPEILVHSAALVEVDRCEKEKLLAYQTNTEATGFIANICQRNRIKMVYFSSDYVFEGNPNVVYKTNSPREPINYYGITKKEAENFVSGLVQDNIIIRPTILYGFNDFSDKKNFVIDIIEKLKRGDKIELDNRRVKYPLLIDDVTHGLMKLLNENYRGIYHMSGLEEVTKFQFGKVIAKIFGLDEELIIGRDLKEMNRPYKIRFSDESMVGMHNLVDGLEIVKNQMSELNKV